MGAIEKKMEDLGRKHADLEESHKDLKEKVSSLDRLHREAFER